MKNRF